MYNRMKAIGPTDGDALVIVDLQNDFLPGGSMAVPCGHEVVPVVNRCIGLFNRLALPVYATREWHPPDHCSFKKNGGLWPAHCIAGSPGADFAAGLQLPADATIVSRATLSHEDAYSAFEETGLAGLLHSRGIKRLFIGGLATDYCVLNTVTDALAHGFRVILLLDAIRAVNLQAGDGRAAIDEMNARGAEPLHISDIEARAADRAPDRYPRPLSVFKEIRNR